jgi:hypothetical protein
VIVIKGSESEKNSEKYFMGFKYISILSGDKSISFCTREIEKFRKLYILHSLE